MIRKDISNSRGFARLSPEAAVLFVMMIPHYNPFGKMNGHPGYIKGEICPYVPYLTEQNIPLLLAEINDKTNVKWFIHEDRHWVHSINFRTKHQKLDSLKLGRDLLPDYPQPSRNLVPDYSGTSRELVSDYSPTTPELVADQSETSPPSNDNDKTNEKEREPRKKGEGRRTEDGGERAGKVSGCISDHSWQRFKELMPQRNGKFLDEDACREYWARHPGLWNQWLAAVKNYRGSREVADGAVCSPMKFLAKKHRDWSAPEEVDNNSPPGFVPDLAWEKSLEEDVRAAGAGER